MLSMLCMKNLYFCLMRKIWDNLRRFQLLLLLKCSIIYLEAENVNFSSLEETLDSSFENEIFPMKFSEF